MMGRERAEALNQLEHDFPDCVFEHDCVIVYTNDPDRRVLVVDQDGRVSESRPLVRS